MRHGVRLSAYTGGDLDLSTPEGAYYSGMETLRAKRESAVKSARVRQTRKGRRPGGGERWFGYSRVYANPDEPNHKKRVIVREDIDPVEADAVREAARRVLDDGDTVAAILWDWTRRGIKPVHGKTWWPTTLMGILTSARIAPRNVPSPDSIRGIFATTSLIVWPRASRNRARHPHTSTVADMISAPASPMVLAISCQACSLRSSRTFARRRRCAHHGADNSRIRPSSPSMAYQTPPGPLLPTFGNR